MPFLLFVGLLVANPAVVFDPAEPRVGDPVAIYVSGIDHHGQPGWAEVFGYRFSLQPVGPGVLRGVVGIPSDIEPEAYPVHVRHDFAPGQPAATLHVVGRRFETSKLRVARKFTRRKRSEALKARLRRERAEIQRVWTSPPSPGLDLGQPRRPTDSRLTGFYGTARVFNETRRSVHYGVDLGGDIGDPVFAAADGRVALSAMRWGSGGTLVVDHGGGLFTVYFHLSKRRVALGDKVERGQRIGDIGKSGRVTGPHLHFGVAVQAAYADGPKKGQARALYVDPEAFWSMRLSDAPPARTAMARTSSVVEIPSK